VFALCVSAADRVVAVLAQQVAVLVASFPMSTTSAQRPVEASQSQLVPLGLAGRRALGVLAEPHLLLLRVQQMAAAQRVHMAILLLEAQAEQEQVAMVVLDPAQLAAVAAVVVPVVIRVTVAQVGNLILLALPVLVVAVAAVMVVILQVKVQVLAVVLVL